VCDCDFKPLEAKCDAGKCTVVPVQDDAGSGREQQCSDVNAKIEAETDRLRTCEAAAECGRQLPTLGSCGCTHNLVGRLDADTSTLQALFTQRSELSDVAACEDLGGPCDCPNKGGVDCVAQRCEWVDIADEDACVALDGTFKSVDELECGLGPDGVALCRWSLTFTTGTFTWDYSDITDAGSYRCKDGAIAATNGGGSMYAGTVTDEGKLTFDGVVYERTP
jgi:hypothetical protein